jgi:arabinogalactan endo-1,4-beta-galactosidase
MMKRLYLLIVPALLLGLAACGKAEGGAEWWLGGEAIEAGIFVEKVDDLSPDFIRGADVSSLLSLEASGVRFYDFSGNEQDMLKTLAENGFNYIRVRIWNDPFDEDGNGYGGGNNDINAALELGRRAAEYGMKTLVNLHYSDFWADPGKQQAPKAWEGMTIDQKEQALYDFTKESVEFLLDGGVDVGMVQIGNETTTGLSGETDWPRIARLKAAGANAVRAVAAERELDILIAIHLTNPESHNFVQTARVLEVNGVDYDVFATSYYPFWHGTLQNLATKLGEVAERFGKKVMVAEVAYAYSWDDFDGHANTIGEGSVFERFYPLTIQGQARAIADVVAVVASLGDAGIGVFYWEPGWIPVPGETWEERSALWEKHGSGWASSFAAGYCPDDAGVWFGGSACDNQALFDAAGHPLESLKVFGFCYTGAVTERRLDEVYDAFINVRLRNPVVLPETVTAVYNDGATEEVAVEWGHADLDAISNSPVGVYRVTGSALGMPVTVHVSMEEENYVENHSFEDEDRSMWIIDNIGNTQQIQFQEKVTDARSGRFSLHFWDPSYVEFTVEQTVTGLRPGTYSFAIFLQGGDAVNPEMYIYAIADGVKYRQDTDTDGWVNWRQPKIPEIISESGDITVGVYIRSNGGWGTMDDFQLCPVE